MSNQFVLRVPQLLQAHRLLNELRASLSYYHRPRRAFLYVPGDDQRKLRKVTNLDVDCVIVDCEDGVAINRKDVARKTISEFLSTHTFNGRTDYGVRVNSIESGLVEEDLKVICGGKVPPKAIFLPKVNTIKDLGYFGEHLKASLIENNKNNQKLELFIFAETCATIMDLPDICRRAIELSNNYPFRLSGIIFGSDDFCASLGARRSEKSIEILYARQKVALVAKAFNLEAVDMVTIDLQNDDDLRVQTREGASFGYTGKQVIHPKQISIVQSAFMPTQDEIKWASELYEAYKSYQESGKGAFMFNGKMIDAPTIKQAENVMRFIKKN